MSQKVKLFTSTALIGAALATPLAFAPGAGATCASFWGLGNGGGCTSVVGSAAFSIGEGASAEATAPFSLALAAGPNATAAATGIIGFNIATAIGRDANASTDNGRLNIATAIGYGALAKARNGNGNLAVAIGGASQAEAGDVVNADQSKYGFNRAIALGRGNAAFATNGGRLSALVIGSGSVARAGGQTPPDLPYNFSGNVTVSTIGVGSQNTAQGFGITQRVRGNGVTGGASQPVDG
jgi:hypothetical protein